MKKYYSSINIGYWNINKLVSKQVDRRIVKKKYQQQ